MATIEKSIVIEAPVEQVFEYLTDPEHLPEIWPSMVEVRDVETLPNGGHRYHWVYSMAGKRFEGDSETVEIEPNSHFLSKTTGGIPAAFDYTFTPENGHTKIDVKTDYELPQSLLGKLAEPFLRKLNERESDTFLANLKDRLET